MKIPEGLKSKKAGIYIVLGILVLGGIFWYVNKYIYHFEAAFPKAQFNLTSSTNTVDLSQGREFTVAFSIGGQKVSAVDLYVTYDPRLVEYYKEYESGPTGFHEVHDPSVAPYFNDPSLQDQANGLPIIEEVMNVSDTERKLRLTLVSTYVDPNNPNWQTNVTGNLKFRAKATGTATIRISTGDADTKLAGADNQGNATYFDLPNNDIAVAVNIINGQGQGTVTPTQGAGGDTPTQSPSNAPDISATPGSGESGNVTMNMKIKFQGMPDGPRNGTKSLKVAVNILSVDHNAKGEAIVDFVPEDGGVWSGTVQTNLDTSKKYAIYLKGEKHLMKKICLNNPSESIPGGYTCRSGSDFSEGQIQLTAGTNDLNFSNIVMLAGDIPVQNGIVDAVDYSFIRQNFGSQDAGLLARGDLNYDGIIDTQDYSLILAALSFKYDEE